MKLVELSISPLEGELNVNSFIAGPNSTLLLQKKPKDNPFILRSIAHEYNSIGFINQGGKFRKRAPQEQIRFVEYAASQGLRVLPPTLVSAGIAYYPFLDQAKTLDDYLPDASDEDLFRTVHQLFSDLKKAHDKNIIYGDRWSRNILVAPGLGVVNVDFDIEISGRPAKEFEVAQAAYYTLSAGKDRIISFLTEILSREDDWFNFALVAEFMQKHAAHFLHSPRYGNIENETDLLLELIKKRI